MKYRNRSDVLNVNAAETCFPVQENGAFRRFVGMAGEFHGGEGGAGKGFHPEAPGYQNFQIAEGTTGIDTAVLTDFLAAGQVQIQLAEVDLRPAAAQAG